MAYIGSLLDKPSRSCFNRYNINSPKSLIINEQQAEDSPRNRALFHTNPDIHAGHGMYWHV